MDERRVDLVERVLAFDGYFKIIRYRLQHSLFEGGMSPEITREVFERGQAAAVLPYDPKMDQVVLIEQFRPGAFGVNADPWLIEIIAGIIEPNEQIEDVARREAREEAGLVLSELKPIGKYFVSPGGTTETVSMFIGRVSSDVSAGFFGLAAEGEDIKVHVVKYETAMAWLAKGKINVLATIVALQWLALNRREIREAWQPERSKS